MVDRLRHLAERPLDRRVARAILILGLAVTVGAGLLVGLGAVEEGRGLGADRTAGAAHGRTEAASVGPSASVGAKPPGQDPQDRRDTPARRRAIAELRSHRALQHVPYRHGGVSIVLAGARGSRAVLRVAAPTILAARTGWRDFLRRFDDAGTAYLPRFRGGRGRG